MIFDFIKSIFWKADEASKKRKADEPIFLDEETYFKKHRFDCISNDRVKVINEPQKKQTMRQSINSVTSYRRNNGDSSYGLSDKPEFTRQWPPKQGCHLLKTLEQKHFTSNLNPTTMHYNSSTLLETYRLDEKRKYKELLANFCKGNQRQIVSSDAIEPSKSRSEKTININDSKASQDSTIFDLTKLLPENKRSLNHFSNNDFSSTLKSDIMVPLSRANVSRRSLDERIQSLEKTLNKADIDSMKSRTPIEEIKVNNSLKEKLANKEILKPNYFEELSKKFDLRINEKSKAAEELSKLTTALSRTNLYTRESYLEKNLQRSQKLVQAFLEEPLEEEEYIPPELTPDMMKEINGALSRGPDHQVFAEEFGLRITRKDIRTLAGLNWLNDEVINFYMNLLIKRGESDEFPSVYAMNTFFYPKLLSSGYSSLRRWTRKIDIFSKDLIVIPVHLGMHWCMSIIDFRNKTIKYYDSMGSPNDNCLVALKRYLSAEHLDKKKEAYSTEDWSLENVRDIPQQMNGSDCGVFSCTFAEYVCANRRFTFSQENMPYIRNKMVYEILKAKLL